MGVNPNVAQVEEILSDALTELETITNLDKVEQWRIEYLGRGSKLTEILRSLSSIPPVDRRKVGAAANQAKSVLQDKHSSLELLLKDSKLSKQVEVNSVDISLPGWPVPQGGLHVITRTVREICDIFTSMGFGVVEGPEVELERYNFEMLNIPKNHPARDMWNSLWIDYTDRNNERPMLLRTHTSPMQARFMEQNGPPVRIVVPGKCYRYEATDATHEWHFYQIEGLAVDKGITLADLKGTLYEFVKRIFGQDRQVRFRCDYFPFVEPGVDMSIDCFVCNGNGCRVCSETGWIEIMGAGMVHPAVLKGVGYDPDVYTGFAFGMGPERVAMLKYGINDIRHFYSNDLRFLRQF